MADPAAPPLPTVPTAPEAPTAPTAPSARTTAALPSGDPEGWALLAALGLPALGLPAAVHTALGEPGPAQGTPAFAPEWRVAPQPGGGRLLLRNPHASGDPAQPWALLDRLGTLHLAAAWHGTALREAWLRLPGAGWLALRTRTERHPLWGEADGLWHHAGPPQPATGAPVAMLPALDYGALRHLPPLDRPGALPPGAGGALLNFLALLLRLQGTDRVTYRGPYPSDALFASLCRSFAPEGSLPAARQRFTQDVTALAFRGALVTNPLPWRPAPFAPLRPRPELLLEVRDGVERAWVRDVPFERGPPQSAGGERSIGGGRPALPAGQRVWAEAGLPGQGAAAAGFAVGLVLLGRPALRFYRLAPDGTVRQAAALQADPPPAADLPPLDARWREVLRAWATLRAHAGLAAEVAAELEARLEGQARALPLQWAPLALRIAALQGPGLRLHALLPAAFRQRVAAGEDAAGLALMLISDVLEAATPLLLRRAQQRLGEAPPPQPEALLAAGQAAQAAARGRLAAALPRLLEALARGEALPEEGAAAGADQEPAGGSTS